MMKIKKEMKKEEMRDNMGCSLPDTHIDNIGGRNKRADETV